jgi:uncharacterized protein
MIEEQKIMIGRIPAVQITCGECSKGVIVFYHGWSSQKELQSLRGHILAAYCYDVIIPDAIYHGERGPIDYNAEASYPLFWETIFQNVEEASQIVAYIKTWKPRIPLAVMGHSMGGISTLGVMTHCQEYNTAVSLNGSGWWDESERRFRAALHIDKPEEFVEVTKKINALDPYTHMDQLRGRSVLALNGGADSTVDSAAQEMYMEKMSGCADINICFQTYPGLCHFVTTNMMDDAIQWINKTI